MKAVLWGLGVMGRGIAKLLLEKGAKIVGAIDVPPIAGEDIGHILGGPKMGLSVSEDSAAAFSQSPDVAFICTSSFVEHVFPSIALALRYGAHVVTISEEMAYPWAGNPELAGKIDDLAKKANKAVVGTGVNPGFVLDTLVTTLTGVCAHVEHIHAKRVNDLTPFGPTVMRTQGVGTTPEEFRLGIDAGTIVGHVGFPESIKLIGNALGWDIQRIVQEREPIISKVERRTEHAHVLPGRVAGCRHTARGYANGKEVILLEHPQQICPEAEGVETGDYINIQGTPPVNLCIKPEIPGGIGTIAMAVNILPLVVKAPPGLWTMADLPIPRATTIFSGR